MAGPTLRKNFLLGPLQSDRLRYRRILELPIELFDKLSGGCFFSCPKTRKSRSCTRFYRHASQPQRSTVILCSDLARTERQEIQGLLPIMLHTDELRQPIH